MRKIIFKGKRIDNNKWVYGDLVQLALPEIIPQISTFEMPKGFAVSPETVCQFTGFKDQEGRDVYEGDKLSMDDLEPSVFDTVIWSNEWQFHTKNNLDHSQEDFDCADCKVIGNIHD